MDFVDAVGLLLAVPLVAVALLARRRGRRWAGVALLTAAPLFLPLAEDAGLATWFGLVGPSVDPDAVAGVVHPHTRFHLIGAGVWAATVAALAIVLARGPVARGERWAWWALLGAFLAGGLADAVLLLATYPHGLPLGGGAGFGWTFLADGFFAWIAGLALTWRST